VYFADAMVCFEFMELEKTMFWEVLSMREGGAMEG
jgi:hypothetical protein